MAGNICALVVVELVAVEGLNFMRSKGIAEGR